MAGDLDLPSLFDVTSQPIGKKGWTRMRSAQVTRCTESSVPVDACVCDTYQVEMIVPVGNYCLPILCVLRSPGDIKMLTFLASWLLGFLAGSPGLQPWEQSGSCSAGTPS